MLIEFLILLVLIGMNGYLAMSEIALAASRQSRLETMIDKGDNFAKKVLKLIQKPNEFLSTIQVGITFIGILTGMVSAATVIQSLAKLLNEVAFLEVYSQILASAIILFFITFLMILFGELIPKRIALSNPERISKMVIYPVLLLGKISAPLVWLLSFFTDFFSKLILKDEKEQDSVSEEEIRSMIRIGAQEGSLKELEMELLNKVFHLDDLNVAGYQTHKREVVWLDLDKSWNENRTMIFKHPHKAYPVANGKLDESKGVIYTKKVLQKLETTDEVNLEELIEEPLIIPETLNLAELIIKFQKYQTHFAMVVDEFGEFTGIITMNEISEALLGEIAENPGEKIVNIVERVDGTYFVEASIPFEEFMNFFQIRDAEYSGKNSFYTAGGFVLNHLRRVPKVSEMFIWNGLEIEIADLDGRRIDKLIVKKSVKEDKND